MFRHIPDLDSPILVTGCIIQFICDFVIVVTGIAYSIVFIIVVFSANQASLFLICPVRTSSAHSAVYFLKYCTSLSIAPEGENIIPRASSPLVHFLCGIWCLIPLLSCMIILLLLSISFSITDWFLWSLCLTTKNRHFLATKAPPVLLDESSHSVTKSCTISLFPPVISCIKSTSSTNANAGIISSFPSVNFIFTPSPFYLSRLSIGELIIIHIAGPAQLPCRIPCNFIDLCP
jgi:hypothetical protein